jgi:hypothetical protein
MRGCAPGFHAFGKRSMEAHHAQATATRRSGDFGTSAVSETRKPVAGAVHS